MKLGMKYTFCLFLALLVGLVAGGGWLRWASYRDARAEARAEAARLLDALGPGLASEVAEGNQETVRHLLEFARESFPAGCRIEVTDREGRRLGGVGLPPEEGGTLDAIYKPLSLPDGSLVGAVQLLLARRGVEERAALRVRPGGTALFVGMLVAWIVAEVLTTLAIFSPIKKLHRALLRVLARPAPVDLELLREETRTQGADEVDAIVHNTCAVIERELVPGTRLRSLPSREGETSRKKTRDGTG